ncbi:MAG: hypothetical protein J2P22_06345 [Nocardioides sp.]|nr:hypothetical protein [Nocardioides sp.]
MFGRKRKPRVLSEPVVRFLRIEDCLLAETVKPFPSSGEPPVDDVLRDRLRSLGWLMPGDEGYEPSGGPYCRLHLRTDQAADVVRLAARTLVALGIEGPDRVEQDSGR